MRKDIDLHQDLLDNHLHIRVGRIEVSAPMCEPGVTDELNATEYVGWLYVPFVVQCGMQIVLDVGLQEEPEFAEGYG
jgi:hypothetical protein